MSVRQIDAVFRYSRSTGSARLVLLAIADVASDDGEVTAYKRSRRILATKANVDPATVRRAVATLVELGELEVLEVGDGRSSTDYRMHVMPTVEGGRPAPPAGADDPPRGGDVPPLGGRDAPPISPSLIPPAPSPPVAAGPAARKQLLPDGWTPDEALLAWAAEKAPGVDVARELERFTDHWRSKAERRADWPATWRNWMRNAQERLDTRTRPRAGTGRPSEPRLPAGSTQAGEVRL